MSQHMNSLATAKIVRGARGLLKKEIYSGEKTVAGILMSLPLPFLATMPLMELLTSQRQWGRRKALNFLAKVELREHKEVGKLTARQISLVVNTLCH